MNQLPAPTAPGSTDSEGFQNAVRAVLSVSKADLLKEETKWKRARARKRRRLTYFFNGRFMRLTDVYGDPIPQIVA